MKPTAKSCKMVDEWLTKWRGRMFLQEWFVHVDYRLDSLDDSNKLAEISSNTIYKNATVTIFAPFFKRQKYVQEMAIVHELSHLVTQEYKNALESMSEGVYMPPHLRHELNERITNHISNMLCWSNGVFD